MKLSILLSTASAAMFGVTALSANAFAQSSPITPVTVEVTSFHYIEQPGAGSARNTTAEVCGVAKGTLTGTEKVLLVVDPKYNPGDYVAIVSPRGNFCAVINSLTGRLEFGLIDAQNKLVGSLQEYRQ